MLLDAFVPFDRFPSIVQTGGRAGFLPPADVVVNDDDTVLTMDLPGVAADDLEIEALDGELVVRGERRHPQLGEGSQWAHSERAFGRFERRIRLRKGVDPAAITASMENGVLSLVVPKPEVMKPRTIAIGSGTQQRELETAAA